ncbi:type IV pilus modification protein PilV [Litchfieldella rifensis]|uniref:Type IV pilus modification protein PilV n=1 Tax=Litchfieldella rifensis TaxID=762643 RepID=A0ABV7LP55_9GAMM
MLSHRAQYATRGFTLVEALIALLVLSFGLLGVAAMQLKAMQGAHVSYQRSLATVIASDANERLWAALGIGSGTCPSDSSVQAQWLDHWDDALPSVGASSIVAQASCEYTITVTWDDERFSAEGDISTLTYVARLPGAP